MLRRQFLQFLDPTSTKSISFLKPSHTKSISTQPFTYYSILCSFSSDLSLFLHSHLDQNQGEKNFGGKTNRVLRGRFPGKAVTVAVVNNLSGRCCDVQPLEYAFGAQIYKKNMEYAL
ncbi:hypothetical protein SLE2022_014690 [Rubroshorea leprosula]